jgi:hypothetical protein
MCVTLVSRSHAREEVVGVLCAAVLPNLKVQMGAGRFSRGPHSRDQLTPLHCFPDSHLQLITVPVPAG